VPPNQQFGENECDFKGQNLANSLLFSLLAGNLAGEELAPDCALRHAVWTAEKPGCNSRKIARNGHNFASLADKPDWRKCATCAPEPTLGPFSLKSPLHSPVSKTPSGECNAITKRCCGEGDLTSWKWKILPFHPPSWAATLNGDTIGKGVRSNRTVWVVTSTIGVVGPGWIRTILKFDVLPSPRPWWCGLF
jgi:hypothetical protein